MSSTTLHPILGDQLSHQLASLRQARLGFDRILMVEAPSEASYVPHHPQKIALFFAAMRQFSQELEQSGHLVTYLTFDQHSYESLSEAISGELGDCSAAIMTEPGEYRVKQELSVIPGLQLLEDDRFVCSQSEFQTWLSGRKQPRMEHFYRQMRRKTGLLMDGDEPVGGEWNFDSENRKKWDGSIALSAPVTHPQSPETVEAIGQVSRHFGNNFGTLDGFNWPTSRNQALVELDHFIEHRLPLFGDFQDAMRQRDLDPSADFLFHSKVSTSLNLGLLTPIEVCQAAERAYQIGSAPLNAVEGFIRQIIGWREYVRGLYWAYMPEYKERNFLAADAPLPPAFWGADTKMNCVAQSVDQTRRTAYAHHIQRLMVTGNLALLLGVLPSALNEWYLSVYADAIEWVQLPNTHGMVAYADGGLMGSKPYAASGKYIDRQGDYCKNCYYRVKDNDGEKSCPLNSLYWDFMNRHADKFRRNPRMAMPLRTWDKMAIDKRQALLERAAVVKRGLADGIV